MSRLGALTAALFTAFGAAPVLAQEILGQPHDWRLGFQSLFTPIGHLMNDFHNMLLIIITGVTVLVLVLMLFVIVRYRESRNQTPARTTHNTVVEIIWTTIPVLVLVIIAIPSFRLLYASDRVPESAITIKATGLQWYWNYEYEHPEQGNFDFDSFILTDQEAQEEGLPRLLGADQSMVVPTGTNIRVLVTGGDVIHGFSVPSFGIKVDAVPGRLNETWFRVDEPGLYFGQCTVICGTNHAYMPIQIRAVPPEEYEAWLDDRADQLAQAPSRAPAEQLARADQHNDIR